MSDARFTLFDGTVVVLPPELPWTSIPWKGETCYTADGDITMRGGRGSVTTLEAAILAELATGKTVLEIGTGAGVSTWAMSKTAAQLTTVDNALWVQENVHPGLAAAGVRCLTKVEGGPYEMVFIDGDHSTAGFIVDVALAWTVTQTGSLLTFHDLHLGNVAAGVRILELPIHLLGTALGLGFMTRTLWAPSFT